MQVIGSYIRDDREWWNSWGSGDSAITVFRLKQISNTNRHLSNGTSHDLIYTTAYIDLLSTMGWDVLRAFNLFRSLLPDCLKILILMQHEFRKDRA